MDFRMTRRDLLKNMAIGVASTALAACAPKTAKEKRTQELTATTQPPTTVPTTVPPTPAPPKEPLVLKQVNWGTATRHQKRDAELRKVFPELEDTKVEFEVADSTPERLRLALAANQDIPDMLRFNVNAYIEFAASNELLDVTEYFEPVKDDLYAGAKGLCFYEGKFVAFPCQIKSKMFWYRQDLFEESGIDPKAIVSFQDFINAGKALNSKFPKSYIINLGPHPVGYWLRELLSAYEDARVADETGRYLVTEHKGFKDAFELLKGIVDSGIAFPVDDWASDWQQAFAEEAICGSLCANWMKTFIPPFAPAQTGKWEGKLWPQLTPYGDQRYGTDAGGAVYAVPKRGAHPKEAADYLAKNFLTKDGWMASFRAYGLVPLMKSAEAEFLEANRNLKKPADMSDEDWAAQPTVYFGPEALEIELQSYEFARVFKYDPSNLTEFSILSNWLYSYIAGEVELDEALSRAQEDMETQIGNPYEL